MKLYSIQSTQLLPISIQKAWEFFSNPNNLPLITPPSLGFKIVSEVPKKMYPGMIITYTVTPILSIPVSWVTEITQVQEPQLFVDEQRFGPYRFWHHKHFFREIEDGVEMHDMVHYALPLGFLGRIVIDLVVKPKLESIFNYRREVLEKMFGTFQK